MLTKKQIRILSVFLGHPFTDLSYNEIKRLAEERSGNGFQLAMNAFKKEKLLIEKKIGTSRLYRIDHKNKDVHRYMALGRELPEEVEISIRFLREELEKRIHFYTVVIFGSYAKGTQKKDSDLDIAVIVPDKGYEASAKGAVASAGYKSIPELDAHVFTRDDFEKMLRIDQSNVGKEIVVGNIPVINEQIFYRFVRSVLSDDAITLS